MIIKIILVLKHQNKNKIKIKIKNKNKNIRIISVLLARYSEMSKYPGFDHLNRKKQPID